MSEVFANTNALIDLRDFTFRFRANALGTKRTPVELRLAVPSAEGLADVLNNGGKPLELLQDIVADYIRAQALDVVAENEGISQENFPHEKFTFEYLANLTREDRRVATISPEQWTAFSQDYMSAMQVVTGKAPELIGNAIALYVKKLVPAKTNKPLLSRLKEQLSIYAETPNAEQFEDILTLLVRRADAYLAADDQALTAEMI